MTIDSKHFYLKLGLFMCDHTRIKMSTTPAKFEEEHNLHGLVDAHGHAYGEIRDAMHGLSQVGRLAYEDLVTHLTIHGCKRAKCTPGLWKHIDNGIMFALIQDDFRVKFCTMKSLEYFINDLKHEYGRKFVLSSCIRLELCKSRSELINHRLLTKIVKTCAACSIRQTTR